MRPARISLQSQIGHAVAVEVRACGLQELYCRVVRVKSHSSLQREYLHAAARGARGGDLPESNQEISSRLRFRMNFSAKAIFLGIAGRNNQERQKGGEHSKSASPTPNRSRGNLVGERVMRAGHKSMDDCEPAFCVAGR